MKLKRKTWEWKYAVASERKSLDILIYKAVPYIGYVLDRWKSSLPSPLQSLEKQSATNNENKLGEVMTLLSF